MPVLVPVNDCFGGWAITIGFPSYGIDRYLTNTDSGTISTDFAKNNIGFYAFDLF